MQKESPIREPLILGDKSYHDITVDVAKPVLAKANKMWWVVFGISLILFLWSLILYFIIADNSKEIENV